MEKNQRQLNRRNNIVIAGFIVSIIFICGLSAVLIVRAVQGDRREATASFEGVTVDAFVEFDDEEAYPEAITVGADGNLYSGSFCTGEVWRISPEGAVETLVDGGISSVYGLAYSPDDLLYVVDHGDCEPGNAASSIKTVDMDGNVAEFTEADDSLILNGLAFDGAGVLYAIDAQNGEVRTYDAAGESNVWWELPENDPRPTGIAYDEARNALIVADSNNGIVYRVTIGEDGELDDIETLYEREERELDGLTVDDQGRVIFTIYDTNRVALLDENGQFEILAEDFREPSDVAYLDGRIYVTNFDSISLAPVISWMIGPSLPFTIDVIDLSNTTLIESP